MLQHTFPNATQVLLRQSNQCRLENMKNKPNDIHTPYENSMILMESDSRCLYCGAGSQFVFFFLAATAFLTFIATFEAFLPKKLDRPIESYTEWHHTCHCTIFILLFSKPNNHNHIVNHIEVLNSVVSNWYYISEATVCSDNFHHCNLVQAHALINRWGLWPFGGH